MITCLKTATPFLYKAFFLSILVFGTSCATEEIEEAETATATASTTLAAKPTDEVTKINKGQTYYIRNKHSGLFLDLKNYGKNGETNVHQWEFTGLSNQKWKIEDFEGNARLVSVRENGKSIAIANIDERGNVQVATTKPYSYQKFTIYAKSSGSSQFYIKSITTQRVLDVAGYSKNNGGNVHQFGQFEDNGKHNNQLWEFYEVD